MSTRLQSCRQANKLFEFQVVQSHAETRQFRFLSSLSEHVRNFTLVDLAHPDHYRTHLDRSPRQNRRKSSIVKKQW